MSEHGNRRLHPRLVGARAWAASAAMLAIAGLVAPSEAAVFASGNTHVVAIREGGTLVTWGNNAYGNYGDGKVLQSPVPHRAQLPPITQVWSGFGAVIALDTTGRLWSWGDNATLQLGERESGNNAVPARLSNLADVVQVTGGTRYVAALKRDGTVWHWGSIAGIPGPALPPRQVPGIQATAIAGGGEYLLMLRADGTVWGVGSNPHGQLGALVASSPTPVAVPGLTQVERIWAAGSLSFARKVDGSLWMWGGRANVAPASVAPPAMLPVTGRAVSIRGFPVQPGTEVYIATDAGKVYEMPRPPPGETTTAPPVERPQFAGAAEVVPGQNVGRVNSNDFLAALYPDGTLRTQGGNLQGQLGDGSFVDTQAPGFVAPLIADVVAVSTMIRSVVALKRDGSVWTWGSNGRAQQADGVNPSPTTPYQAASISNVTSVVAGGLFTVATRSDGQVWAWGANLQGQFCDGSAVSRSVPAPVPAFAGAQEIVAGGNALAMRLADGSVWFCGYIGDVLTAYFTPQRVMGLPPASRIFASAFTFFALDATGKLWAFGDNTRGQFGAGTVGGYSLTPVQVTGLPGAVTELAGNEHILAAMPDGTVWSWGRNSRGQLGRDTGGQPSATPQVVAGLTQVRRVAAGFNHSLALRTDGVALSWGSNDNGQLGHGDLVARAAPTAIADLAAFDEIAATTNASFGRRADGTAFGWGNNAQNINAETLGDGTYVSRKVPSIVLREGGAGRLDTNDWYLDLKPSVSPKAIPPAKIPAALAVADGGSEGSVSLSARLTYKQADLGRSVGVYVLGLVPPAFLAQVTTVPGTPKSLAAGAKAGESYVLVQLTPQGWGIVTGSLTALVQGVASGASSAHSILDGIGATAIPGARFCIGYAEGGNAVLNDVALREVLEVPGATGSSAEAGTCIFTGTYLTGPAHSSSGSSVAFNASVVGIAPTGNVTLRDGGIGIGTQALAGASNAVRSTVFSPALSAGSHNLDATYAGDGTNAASTSTALTHIVASRTPTAPALAGPAASQASASVTFAATVPAAATGFVRFAAGALELGARAVASGLASLVTSALPPGNHSIVAHYEGDAAYAPGASGMLAHSVTAPAPLALALAANPAAPRAGAALMLTATASGGDAPLGTVHFIGPAGEIGAAPLQGGSASISPAALAAGSHVFIAELPANGSNPAVSSVPLALQVLPALGAPVSLALSVAGSGTVTSQPAGIDCSAACNASFPGGTSVALTATPAQGFLFAGWSTPACPGAGACTVTLEAAAGITAAFAAVGADLQPSASSVDFAGQSLNTTSLARSWTLVNAVAEALQVEKVLAAGPFAASHDCTLLGAGSACGVAATFTPRVEGASSGSVVVVYTRNAQRFARTIPLAGAGERSLVAHYYQAILRRPPEAGGRQYWEAEATRMAGLGANVNEAWFAMAQAFFGSAEYAALGSNPTDYVLDLYRTFFNRAADPGGLAYWAGQIAAGMPREVVLAGFMFSPEFVAFAQAIFGNTAARAEVDVVVDFYRGLLSRLPDSGGFNHWVGLFRAAQCQGAAAVYAQVEAISKAFAESPEYGARARANAQYVGDLYNAFLRRGGDLAGVQFWIGQLGGVRTREQLRRDFIAAPEFAARVAAVVAQGCLP